MKATPEEVVVDFSRVNAALRLVQREWGLASEREGAEVAKVRAEATTRVVKYGAVGIALVILSIGIAIWLSNQRHTTNTVHYRSPPAVGEQLPPAPPPSPIIQNKVVTSFSKFRSIHAGSLTGFTNLHFHDLTAGHHYRDSNAQRWEYAWCYAMFWKDGLDVKINLAQRGATHKSASVSLQERRQFGLSEADVSFLQSRCPWQEQ